MDSENKNVLIIDDEKETRVQMRSFLENAGYKVFDVKNNTKRIENILKRNRIDLIIIDIHPEKETLRIIIDIKKDNTELKVIAMCGSEFCDTYLSVAKAFGVESTFIKPVDEDTLLHTAHDLLTPMNVNY